ncbi:hypothetical protein B0H13DRAFT_1640619, partial [Mycena leptocephala]
MFDTIRSVLDKTNSSFGSVGKARDNTRTLIMQMVNSLTSKLQIGSPMASLYLLGNPDHYTNLTFKVCWWKSYVSDVRRAWEDAAEPAMPVISPEASKDTDKVVVSINEGSFVGTSNVDDYSKRPEEFEDVSFYDFFQMYTRKKRNKTQLADFRESLGRAPDMELDTLRDEARDADAKMFIDDGDIEEDVPEGSAEVGDWSDAISEHAFHKDHPLFETHYCVIDRRGLETTVPNFVGGSLPRVDQGDREYYCCTMLTLFKPWRTGKDLKLVDESWDDAFTDYVFSSKATKMMKNFNIRYECNDARDDYSASVTKRPLPTFSKWETPDHAEVADVNGDRYGEEVDTTPVDVSNYGEKWLEMEYIRKAAASVMKNVGWTKIYNNLNFDSTVFTPLKFFTGHQWKAKVTMERDTIFSKKYANAPAGDRSARKAKTTQKHHEEGVSILDSFYFTKYFWAKNQTAQNVLRSVVSDWGLNTEQERAFKLIANHAISDDPEQLKMYLGGVGGTGKSTVIKALIDFFERRNERHRFIVLAPTGTAAALLNGST